MFPEGHDKNHRIRRKQIHDSALFPPVRQPWKVPVWPKDICEDWDSCPMSAWRPNIVKDTGVQPPKFRRIIDSLCLATLALRLPEVDELNCLLNVIPVLVSVSSFPNSLRKGGGLKFTENCVQGFLYYLRLASSSPCVLLTYVIDGEAEVQRQYVITQDHKAH